MKKSLTFARSFHEVLEKWNSICIEPSTIATGLKQIEAKPFLMFASCVWRQLSPSALLSLIHHPDLSFLAWFYGDSFGFKTFMTWSITEDSGVRRGQEELFTFCVAFKKWIIVYRLWYNLGSDGNVSPVSGRIGVGWGCYLFLGESPDSQPAGIRSFIPYKVVWSGVNSLTSLPFIVILWVLIYSFLKGYCVW